MGSMQELTSLVRELEDQLVVCIRCGMCQSVCPLFEQTKKEADVARGKLALLDGLMNSLFSDPEGVGERLNKCLLCGSCAANCPSGVNIIEIFVKARAIVTEYQGLSPVKKMVLRKMLSNPGLFDSVMEWAGRFQKIFIRDDENPQGTSCARLVSPLLKNRHFLPVAKNPFHKNLAELSISSGGSGPRVAFFTGCLIDKIFPSIGQSAVSVFNHHKVGMHIPEGQGCCGIPALASGDRETFNRLVEHNLALFQKERFDYLVTACATCTSTIKKLWPKIYTGSASGIRKTLADFSEKTLDINQFLVNIVKIVKTEGDNQDAPEMVTYHDPCHLKKSLGVADEPRALIQASGRQLVEMAGSDKCCGMGGSFNLYHYDISSDIGSLKQKNISDTGASTVATGCPACMMQISDMLAKNNARVNVRHPIEIYAGYLKENGSTN